MYESHFGFSGAPFSLNADPEFFFGSQGHSNALSYLKFGVYQGEGFVVVTGEIGAGKTTLVRTLLSGLESEKIVAAQIVSTQLEAGDLLRSIALAFGIAPKSLSKAELIGTIEAFLMLLATEERRALLIVDEAQNLDRAAIEELRMLSNFQLGNQALLQSFLVGQPELRVLLTGKPMEQFRQRIIASCHLGPMTIAETGAYIEHRLRRVGWTGNPAFDATVYERVFHWSAGIPRRVNLLCNRLLLAAFLGEKNRLDGALVDTVGEEMRNEVAAEVMTPPTPPHEGAHAASSAVMAASIRPAAAVAAPRAAPAAGPLLVAAASDEDDIKAAVLLRAWQGQAAHRRVRLRIGTAGRLAGDDAFCAGLGGDATVVPLEVDEPSPGARIGEVMRRFAGIVADERPSAIAVVGDDDAAIACAIVARKAGCRLVHLEAGERAPAGPGNDAINGVLIDRLADVFYPVDHSAYLNLIREGAAESDVLCAGSLLVDAVDLAIADARATPRPALRRLPAGAAGPDLVAPDHGYGLVLLDRSMAAGDDESIAQLLSNLHEISHDKRLLWLLDPALAGRLDAAALRGLAKGGRIDIAAPPGFVDRVALLAHSALVVTDDADLQLMAAALQVRCLRSDPGAAPAHANEPAPPPARGGAAQIARHLAHWLGSRPL